MVVSLITGLTPPLFNRACDRVQLSLSERFRAFLRDPPEAVREAGVSEGQRVADIGAGYGYFTVPASVLVGPKGLVYSVEPNPARSEKIRRRVEAEGLENVRVLTTGAEHLDGIPSGSVDLAFSTFSLHHFVDRQVALAETRRILRDGGAFYVWDRVPGAIVRHGTRPDELTSYSAGFARFEFLSKGRTIRARFTK